MIIITNLMIMNHDDHFDNDDFSDVPWADDHDTTRDLNMYLGHMIIIIIMNLMILVILIVMIMMIMITM